MPATYYIHMEGGWPYYFTVTQARVTRRESTLLKMRVWQQGWFNSCKGDMCKHLARHGKQSYPSITTALRLRSFSFIQLGLWCPGAIPFPRPEWLFCAVCLGHHCHRVGCNLDRYRILLGVCCIYPEHQGQTAWANLVKCWSTPATLQQ